MCLGMAEHAVRQTVGACVVVAAAPLPRAVVGSDSECSVCRGMAEHAVRQTVGAGGRPLVHLVVVGIVR